MDFNNPQILINSMGYQDMLKKAQDSYSGILAGYQKALSSQRQSAQRVNQGYNQLQQSVLGRLQGSGAARSQEIADYYTGKAGAANQDLINRGLGNTTVASSVGRGFAYDQSKAQTELSNTLSNQVAEYQSKLGLAGLGYRGHAADAHTALMGQSLGYQADWQKSLLGAGLQRSSLFGAGGGGGYGGFGGGGGNYTDILRPPTKTHQSETLDPYIDFNMGFPTPGGGGGGGGGGGDGGGSDPWGGEEGVVW